jgi:hypothetical protein
LGTLSPSIQLLTNSPICSGFAHLLKSEFSIDCLLDSVSIVYGRSVITLTPLSLASSDRLSASECSAVLANEYAII